MRSVSIGLFASFFLVAGIPGVAAQSEGGPRVAPSLGRIAVTPHVGTELAVDGKLISAGSTAISELALFVGVAFDGPGRLTVNSRGFADFYGKPLDVGFDVAYGVSGAGEVFGGLRHLHASGKKTSVGTFSVSGSVSSTPFAANSTLLAKPGDFSATSVEAGYRHFLTVQGPVLAYVAGSLGATRTIAIDADLFVSDGTGGDLRAKTVRIYDQSVRPFADVQIGFTHIVGPQGSIGVEMGLRYEGALKGNDRDIAAGDNGLTAINDSSYRVSVPLRLTGRFAF